MSIQAGICRRFWKDALSGLHRPGDTWYIALFTPAATLGRGTEYYSAQGEVRGAGYEPGGRPLTSPIIIERDGWTHLSVGKEVVWAEATIKAAGALVYNSNRSGAAICVLNFGEVKESGEGPFKVKFDGEISAGSLFAVRDESP